MVRGDGLKKGKKVEKMDLSYVCTRVVFHSKSDQAGRFEKKIPEANDLDGTEMTPHSPPS